MDCNRVANCGTGGVMRVLGVIALLAALLVLWILSDIVNASTPAQADCVDATSASTGRGSFTAMSKQICRTSKDSGDVRSGSANTGPRIETVDCGRVKVGMIS